MSSIFRGGAFWRRVFTPFALLGALSGPSACGSPALPTPELAQHTADDYVIVPYPPPAAAAEIVPPSPGAGAVWVDGQWSWRGRYFVWHRGGWVIPEENALFAPWTRGYTKDGTLYFAEPTWRTKEGLKLRRPRVLRPAGTPPTLETPEAVATP